MINGIHDTVGGWILQFRDKFVPIYRQAIKARKKRKIPRK